MPYAVSKVKGGYKVTHAGHAFSKKAKSKAGAEAQRRAIQANTHEHFSQGAQSGR